MFRFFPKKRAATSPSLTTESNPWRNDAWTNFFSELKIPKANPCRTYKPVSTPMITKWAVFAPGIIKPGLIPAAIRTKARTIETLIWNQKAVEMSTFLLSVSLGMKLTRAAEMPRSPMLERRVTRALRAEKRPNRVGPRARAVMTVKIIPTTAMVPNPVKLIRVSLEVCEKKRDLIFASMSL